MSLGARMVPFAGYEMPVQYPLGILKEHLHTREKAGLFDVSHMGQAFLIGPDHATTAAALEALVPADILNLGPGQQRYTQLLNDEGGIIDDLMVTRSASADDDGSLMLVVNASRKEVDYAHIAERLPDDVRLQPAPERALLALQGPAAKDVLARLSDVAAGLAFMSAASGKVGELRLPHLALGLHRRGRLRDLGCRRQGREAGAPAAGAGGRAADRPRRARLAAAGGGPVPLRPRHRRDDEPGRGGARLVDPEAPPGARAAFPGAARIQRELAQGPTRRRVGIKPDGRAPAREGTEI